MTSKDTKIELKPEQVGRLRALGMNWSCTTQKPFQFRPTTFVSTIEGLKPKKIDQARQIQTVDAFMENPRSPGLIGISSAPNDGQSKLLAAWMMQYHMQASYDNRPVWHDLTGGFDSTLMEHDATSTTMIVLNNIGPDSSQTKKEKFRDILERYSELPIIVVINGADAFTFLTRDMRKPVNGAIYLTNSLVKKAHEI